MDPVRNFAIATVSGGYNEHATTIVLAAGQGAKFPNPATDGAFNLVWFNATDYPNPSDDPNVEIVRCTARSADTLTVTRGQEGTASQTHNLSGKVYKMAIVFTKKTYDDINEGKFKQIQIIAATDTDINGIFVARNLANTHNIFAVSNIGTIRTASDLILRMHTSNAGTIYFGVDGNDYLSFDGINFYFTNAGATRFRIDHLGNIVAWGEIYTGGASPVKVVGARVTGWGAPTGTATRTTFSTETVTLVELARRVKALIDDLTTHGLIGA